MTPRYELAGCPVCGSADAEEVASAVSLRREMEDLWEFQMRRLRPGVPVRHLMDRVVFSQDPPLRLAACPVCGTIYRNPRERGDAVVELYAEEEPDSATLGTLFDLQRAAYRVQMERLHSLVGHTGSGLEVGSYIGAFLAAAAGRGWSFEGIDVNDAATRFACGRGLSARRGTLEAQEGDRRYDAVAIWNCFDQLPDPRSAVLAARRLLAPGGVLAVRVPNGAFYARWRPRLAGPAASLARALLAHNNLLGFPYRHGFTPQSAAGLLRACGFDPVLTLGDTLVPTADRWTRRWAVVEQQVLESVLRAARPPPRRMPWFEVYARAI